MNRIGLHSENRLILERIQTPTVSSQPRLGLAINGWVRSRDGTREQSFQWIGREPKHLVEVLIKLFEDERRVELDANHRHLLW